MDMETYNLLSFMVSILTLILGILGYLHAIRYLPQRNRVFFGKAIDIEMNKVKNQLTSENQVYNEKFEGGGNKIFPQLVIEKLDHRKIEVDSKHKNKNRIITHFVIENNAKIEKIWYIK